MVSVSSVTGKNNSANHSWRKRASKSIESHLIFMKCYGICQSSPFKRAQRVHNFGQMLNTVLLRVQASNRIIIEHAPFFYLLNASEKYVIIQLNFVRNVSINRFILGFSARDCSQIEICYFFYRIL